MLKRRRLWLLLVGLLLLWLGADFTYSRVVRYKLGKWEQSIVRDFAGVREGCQAFSVGQGNTALLMVHGFAGSPDVWAFMAPYFADSGYSCHALLLPGFARDMSVFEQVDREMWSDSIRAELSRLRASHESVYLVAHSLGAAISIDLLLDDPTAADGLVAIAPLLGVSNQRSPFLTSRQWYGIFNRTSIFSDIIATAFDPDISDPAGSVGLCVDPFTPRVIFEQLFALVEENMKRAQYFEAPFLMVVTERDKVVDPAESLVFFDAAPAKEKKLVFHNEAGHLIPRDVGWQDVANEVHAFILGMEQ